MQSLCGWVCAHDVALTLGCLCPNTEEKTSAPLSASSRPEWYTPRGNLLKDRDKLRLRVTQNIPTPDTARSHSPVSQSPCKFCRRHHLWLPLWHNPLTQSAYLCCARPALCPQGAALAQTLNWVYGFILVGKCIQLWLSATERWNSCGVIIRLVQLDL